MQRHRPIVTTQAPLDRAPITGEPAYRRGGGTPWARNTRTRWRRRPIWRWPTSLRVIFAQSEPLAREALEFDRKKQPDDWQEFRAESLLGASLAGQKKYAEAEPLLLEGYQGMVARKDKMTVPDWYHLDRAREWIVQLYQAWGKPEKAAEWKKK
jgi:hypothetical protein